jgi:hypothetical protein
VLEDALKAAQLYRYLGVPLSMKDAPLDTIPTRAKTMNGMLYVHWQRRKYWPTRKADKTCHLIRAVLRRTRGGRTIRATRLAALLGTLESATQGLFGIKLFTDGLSKDLNKAINSSTPASYNNYSTVSVHTRRQLRYLLLDGFKSLQGRQMIHGEMIHYRLQTDWCPFGYGVVIPPNKTTSTWTTLSVPLGPEWRNVWSGAGETWAASMGIMAAATAQKWRDGIVSIQCDNVAAVKYVNVMAAPQVEVNEDLHSLRIFLRATNLAVVASWTPGALILADAPSRKRANIWDSALNRGVYLELERRLLTSQWGLRVTFDLFANHLNRQCPRFGSIQPNPEATWVDSMAHPWWTVPPLAREVYYAFPPPKLLTTFLRKIASEEQTAMLITQMSQNAPMQMLAALMVTEPIVFRWSDKTITNPHSDLLTEKQKPYLHLNWLMVGVVVSGERSWADRERDNLSRRWSNWSGGRKGIRSLRDYGLDSACTAKASEWTWALRQLLNRRMRSKATSRSGLRPGTNHRSGAS